MFGYMQHSHIHRWIPQDPLDCGLNGGSFAHVESFVVKLFKLGFKVAFAEPTR